MVLKGRALHGRRQHGAAPASNPDGDYLPPMPFRCIDYIIQKGADKSALPYLPDRCAQLTVDHNGILRATIAGTAAAAATWAHFFSPTWFTIPDAEATKNLTLLTNALVRRVLVDENGMAKGVAYVDRQDETRSRGLRQGSRAGCIMRGDRAHHAQFDITALASRHREF